jgi:homoserine O-acetyltransferase
MLRLVAFAGAALLTLVSAAGTYDGLVEKKTFVLKAPYTTLGGKEIREVRVGYETIGKLDPAGTNAILIPPFHSGNSPFAGRYKPEDKVPGDGVANIAQAAATITKFLAE